MENKEIQKKKISLNHILRPGRKGVSEVLQDVKMWNEDFTLGKQERVFTKLERFVESIEKNRPSKRDAVIIFLAYCEIYKSMISTAKVMEKSATSLSEVQFSEFNWLEVLSRTFTLIHIDDVDVEVWNKSNKSSSQLSSSLTQSELSNSSREALTNLGIREKDISRMHQSLDSLRKNKRYFLEDNLETKFDSMTAPIMRLMKQARVTREEAIDPWSLTMASHENEQDYLYFKASIVVSTLVALLRYPKEVEQSAFEILHHVSRGLELRDFEVMVSGITALHLSSKCWSDTFRTAGLRELISHGLKLASSTPSLFRGRPHQESVRNSDPEGDTPPVAETAQRDHKDACESMIRKRCIAFEMHCLAAIGYNFNFEQACLLRKGGFIDRASKSFRLSTADSKLAHTVISDSSFKYSRLCVVHDRALLAITALSIARIPKSTYVAAAESAQAEALLNPEEVSSMAGYENLDTSIIYKMVNIIHHYKAKIIPAMEQRMSEEKAQCLGVDAWTKLYPCASEPAPSTNPASAQILAHLCQPEHQSIEFFPSLSPRSHALPDQPLCASWVPSTVSKSPTRTVAGIPGMQEGQRRDAGFEGQEDNQSGRSTESDFKNSIKQLHLDLLNLKNAMRNDPGARAAKQYLKSRESVIRRWGYVPEALPKEERPPENKVQELWKRVQRWQQEGSTNKREWTLQARIAMVSDQLRAWGREPPSGTSDYGKVCDSNNLSGCDYGRGERHRFHKGRTASGGRKRSRDSGILSRLGGPLESAHEKARTARDGRLEKAQRRR